MVKLGDKEKKGIIEYSARCLECKEDYQWDAHMETISTFRREECDQGHTLVYYLSTIDSIRNAYAHKTLRGHY